MKEVIVSNTGPIIALAVVDRLGILKDLFKTVVIPGEVRKEVLEGGIAGPGINAFKKASWIEVRSLSASIDPLLETVLDLGEASVIQLAREIKADFALIDERKARKIARTVYTIRVIGTARILVEAKRKGLIGNVGEVIRKMRDNGYYIHDDIMEFAMRKAGEIR